MDNYRCLCETGYQLQSDNLTCAPPDPTIGYVYLQSTDRLSRISLSGPDYVDETFFSLNMDDKNMVNSNGIIAFDVDMATEKLFYAKRHATDQMLTLYSTKLASTIGNNAQVVVTIGTDHSANGHFEIAVDWVTGNLYLLVASTGRIEVVPQMQSFNHSHRAVVVWDHVSKEAQSLSLHPNTGCMFWINTEEVKDGNSESFFIIKSGMDGSVLSEFLEIGPASSKRTHQPSLVITGTRLFWTSDQNHVIMSVKLDGSDKQVHVESASRQPTLLAANFLSSNNKFYFYDSSEMALYETSLARNFSTFRLRTTLDGIRRIKIPTPVAEQTKNPCSEKPCSQLCLLSPDVIGYRCFCSIGYLLDRDGISCSRNFEKLLLVAHGQNDFLQIDMTAPYLANLPLPVSPSPQNVVAVAADEEDNSICWADNGRKVIACSAEGLDILKSQVIATEFDSVESIAFGL